MKRHWGCHSICILMPTLDFQKASNSSCMLQTLCSFLPLNFSGGIQRRKSLLCCWHFRTKRGTDPANQLDAVCKYGHLLGHSILKAHLGSTSVIRTATRCSARSSAVLAACRQNKWNKTWINQGPDDTTETGNSHLVVTQSLRAMW